MAWKLKLMLSVFAMSAIFQLHAAFYPLWLEPMKSEDSGVAVLATAGLSQNEYVDALKKIRFCVENYPTSPYRAWYIWQLANGLYEVGEPDSAISWFRELEVLPDGSVMADVPGFNTVESARTSARLGLARCMSEKGNVPGMVSYLAQVLPRDDADRVAMAELQFINNRRQSAITLLGETGNVKIQDPVLRMRAGMLYRALRMDSQAGDIFNSLANSAGTPLERQAATMAKLMRFSLPTELIDGQYTGSAVIENGKLEVTITVRHDKITKIVIGGNRFKTPGMVLKSVPRRVMAKGQIIIDPVSGFEGECIAVSVAESEALQKARRN